MAILTGVPVARPTSLAPALRFQYYGRNHGNWVKPEVATMYPPAMGKHEWVEADRKASV